LGESLIFPQSQRIASPAVAKFYGDPELCVRKLTLKDADNAEKAAKDAVVA
jgi:hypothetical protein